MSGLEDDMPEIEDVEDDIPSAALPSGHRLDDYEIVKVLGAGGFGITYLAYDHRLAAHVALKEYLPLDFAIRGQELKVVARSRADAANFKWGLDRFLEEARTLRRLDHPNVVRVLRHFDALGTGFIVMEFVEGETIERSVQAGRWDEKRLWPVLDQIMDACSVIHAAGLLHRDIKPANIMLRADGRPVLIDFGAARQASGGRSRGITAMVSPGFGPPEQYSANSEQGPYTDIYALAATCYFALTGQDPTDAADRVLSDGLIPLAQAAAGQGSPGFITAIERGMRIRPADRPQAIEAWREMFPKPKSADTRRPRGKLGAIMAAAGAAATLVLAGGGWFAYHLATDAGRPASVDLASGGQRIAALPPTQIDPGTNDALWSDTAALGDKGFLAMTTAGKGGDEAAALYTIADLDRPPGRWTGAAGSRGSAVAVSPDGSTAVVGGEAAGRAFLAGVSVKDGAVAELWRQDLGPGQVMGAAYGANIMAVVASEAGDSTVQLRKLDGSPDGVFAPKQAGARVVLHKAAALPDGGGVAAGWLERSGGRQSLFVARFDRKGAPIWIAEGPFAEGGSHANALSVGGGQIHAVGWRRMTVNGAPFYQGVIDTLDLNGKVLGEKVVRQSGSLLLRAVQEAGGGDLFVSGVAFDDLLTNRGGAWWVAQIDAQGRVLETDVNRAEQRHQIAEALAFDPKRGLFALGFSASGDRAEVAPQAALYAFRTKH